MHDATLTEGLTHGIVIKRSIRLKLNDVNLTPHRWSSVTICDMGLPKLSALPGSYLIHVFAPQWGIK
jgi:hypothetical protein